MKWGYSKTFPDSGSMIDPMKASRTFGYRVGAWKTDCLSVICSIYLIKRACTTMPLFRVGYLCHRIPWSYTRHKFYVMTARSGINPPTRQRPGQTFRIISQRRRQKTSFKNGGFHENSVMPKKIHR